MTIHRTRIDTPYRPDNQTTDMVGADRFFAQLRQALAACDPAKPRLIALIGAGGTGKTRRLQEVIAAPRRAVEGDALAVAEVIDLYHVHNHTALGLTRSIYDQLPEHAAAFDGYDAKLRELERSRQAGNVKDILQLREEAVGVFVDELRALSAQTPVVIALDTAERLMYGLSHYLDHSGQVAYAWEWLLKSLPGWGNVTLFLAGRPEAEPLIEQARRTLGENVGVVTMPVDSFDEADSLDYFKAAAATARGAHRPDLAERIEGLSVERHKQAHLLAEGVPILLSLLVENRSLNAVLPEQLRRPVAETARMTDSERRQARTELEAELIRRLIETPELGDVIVALGRAPRGVDADLLKRLIEAETGTPLTPVEVAERIRKARQLTFVKARVEDDRLFLHDEMYAMLKRHVYAKEDPSARDDANTAILDYYKAEHDRLRTAVDALFAPVESQGKTSIDVDQLAKLERRRRRVMTDELFYRLRRDPKTSFRFTYRFMREAILSNDTGLDMQIEIELATYLREIQLDDPNARATAGQWDGALLIRPLPRAWAEGRYRDGVVTARQIRESESGRTTLARDGNTALVLDVWEAYCRTYDGGAANHAEADRLLDSVIQRLEADTPDDFTLEALDAATWRALANKAFAYRVRAYLRRQQGRMNDSVTDYQRAVTLWRQVNVEVELARTLNDMGYAMAEAGDFVESRDAVLRALELRRKLGHRAPVSLSLNTLARIERGEGNYQSAIDLSTRALSLARALEYHQGEGLALIALSEGYRRHAMSQVVPNPEDKADLLRDAIDVARNALEIFDIEGRKDVFHQIESLIEMGCAARDLVKVRLGHPSARDSVSRYKAQSIEYVERAARLAQENNRPRYVDALVNLAYLGFYTGDGKVFDDAVARADAAIPAGYRVDPATGKPNMSGDELQPALWSQLGKLHVVQGHVAFKAEPSKVAPTPDKIEEGTRHYAWGLYYNNLYSRDSVGIRQAKSQINQTLEALPFSDLRRVAKTVKAVQAENNLGKSQMQEFLEKRGLWFG